MNKWTQWYENLPEHTKQSLSQQGIWRDADLIKFTVVAFGLGILLGLAI